MKRIQFAVIFCLMAAIGLAQPITGVKTIPGDYATIAYAFSQLNTKGTASPGVTFIISSGYVEYALNLSLNTNTSSATAPVVFQREAGAAANPKIIAQGGGSYSTDAIVYIAGSDYVTFDGIDLQANDNTIDYGYALVKKNSVSPFDGCQNVTIRNCCISMNRSSSYSTGIYTGDNVAGSTTALTITATSDACNNCRFYSNTITNVLYGFSLNGYNAANPYTLYDQNNEIGVDGANIITNFGGGYTPIGIFGQYQNNLNVSNNQVSTGSVTTAPGLNISGISLVNCTASSGTVSNNTVSLSYISGGSQTVYGIYLNYGGSGTSNTLNVNNNTVSNCIIGATGNPNFYGIVNAVTNAGMGTVNMNNNTVSDIVVPGAGYFYGLDCGYASNVSMNSNAVFNISLTGAIQYVYLMKSGNGTIVLHDNQVHDVTVASGTGIIYGMYNYYYPNNETYYNNQIYNFYHNGSGQVYGMMFYTTNGTRLCYSNSVHTLSSGGGLVYGMYHGSSSPQIYKNSIYDLTSNTTAGQVMGMYLYSGTNLSVYNNCISDLKTPASTLTNAISALYIATATPDYIAYNTIYLNASSTSVTTFGTTGVYFSSFSGTGELKNNVIINLSTPVYTTGPAYTVAFQRVSSSLGNYATTSNNNCFYAGTPGPNNLIYFDGTSGDQSIALFKSRVTPRESASVWELPSFVNVVNHDFHLQPAIATQLESGASRITSPVSITSDFDNDTRWGETGYSGTGTAPDMGADEGNFTKFSPMAYQSSVTDQVSGNVFSGTTNQPVIRIKVTVSGSSAPVTMTQFTVNTAGTTIISDINAAVSKIFYTGNSAVYGPGLQFGTSIPTLANYTISGNQVLSPGDNYFWLVCDVIQTATTGHIIDGQCVNFTLAGTILTPLVTSPEGNLNILGPMAGTYLVGAGNSSPNFVTLTDAINHINHRGTLGPVVFSLTNSSSTPYNTANGEVFPITVGVIPLASAVNTVTIQPAAGVSPVITGSSSSTILKLFGTDYLILNGSNSGGTTRDLTIENTNTTHQTAALWICSINSGAGCTYDTFKNCIIRAGFCGSTAATSYAIFIGSSLGTNGYDNTNLTFDNNLLDRAYYGLRIDGTYANSDNLTITNNVIGSDDPAYGIGAIGILAYYTTGLISKNVVKGVMSSTNTITGIYIGAGCRNLMVSKNEIHNIRGITGSSQNGIGMTVDLASYGNSVTLANNLIYDISGDGSSNIGSYSTVGIKINGISDKVKIYHNTVNLYGMISRAAATSDLSAAIYLWNSVTQVDIRNNIFSNSLENTTGDAKAYAIYSVAPLTSITGLDYNDYYVSGREGILGYFNSTDLTTMSAWQAATGKDANSILADPNLNSPSVLVPYPGSPELDRCPIISITDDFNGVTRVAPVSMGAYETGNDLTPPVVFYTPLSNTHQLTARTLNVTIQDYYSSVPVSGAGLPMLYWKINNNPWSAVTGIWVSGNKYKFTFGNFVNTGDQVSYYIVCQDTWISPNTGATPSTGSSGITANPPACVTSPSSPSVYSMVGALSGVKNIPGDYPNLTGANGFFADMNAKTLSGNLTIRITGNLAEDGLNALNEINSEDTLYRLTIENSGGIHSVSGSYSGALIRFNGVDNITVNGKGKLSIANNITTPGIAMSFSGGCNGNLIDSCMFYGGTRYWDPGNQCISFNGQGNYNRFRYDTLVRGYYGLSINGGYWGNGYGNMIYKCVIGSPSSSNYIGNNGIFVIYQDFITIKSNHIFNIIFNGSPIAVYLEGVTNSVVEKNDIHDIVYNGSSYGGASGITLKSLNAVPNVTIKNNLVRHIAGMGNSPNTGDYNNIPAGIKLFGTATSGINILNNSVYLTPDNSNGLFFNNEWMTALEIGAGISGVNLKNNILQNSIGEDAGKSITTWAYSVYTKGSGSPFASVNNNIYFSSNADNNYVGLKGTAVPPVNNMNMADWRTFTGQDGASMNADPLFSSVNSLVPQAGSPASGAGLPLPGTVDDDFYGNARGTSTTIGAVEMIPSATKTLTVNLFLQGLYTGSGHMKAVSDENGAHWGSSVADHISVELHDTATGNYNHVIYTVNDVSLNTSGVASAYIPAGFSGTYYVTIRHRNSLPTVSASPVSFAGVAPYWNFNQTSAAYGNMLVPFSDGYYGVYAGDINQNGGINNTDLVSCGTGNNGFQTGYQPGDVNGDGIVDSADLTIIDNNQGKATVTP